MDKPNIDNVITYLSADACRNIEGFCEKIRIIIRKIGGTGGLGNNRTNGDHPNYSIVETGYNIDRVVETIKKTNCVSNLSQKTRPWDSQQNKMEPTK